MRDYTKALECAFTTGGVQCQSFEGFIGGTANPLLLFSPNAPEACGVSDGVQQKPPGTKAQGLLPSVSFLFLSACGLPVMKATFLNRLEHVHGVLDAASSEHLP